jgi:hypothetical protein
MCPHYSAFKIIFWLLKYEIFGTTLKNQTKNFILYSYNICVAKNMIKQISFMELTVSISKTKVIDINIILHPVGGDLFCLQHVMPCDNVTRTEVVPIQY